MISPIYVSFEQARKLKEKGFDVEVKTIFKNKDGWEEAIGVAYNYNRFENIQSAPEQWQVVEWLRVNHGIWIPINPKREKINGINKMWYDAEVWKLEPDEIKGYGWTELAETFETPQRAYSAAFDHVLNNLI